MSEVNDQIVEQFAADLERWLTEHPGWTVAQQIEAFSPHRLWVRSGSNGEAYRRLMVAAGYLVPRQPGDDGRLPCGWPKGRADA